MLAEALAALLCLAITGSGALFGRYPLWRAARDELVQQANEKRKKRKSSMGASWFFS